MPDNLSLQKLTTADLPDNWNVFLPPNLTQAVGDKFISNNKYCLLQIPAAVTQGDFNILINPYHAEFSNINIIAREKFPFDERIFR